MSHKHPKSLIRAIVAPIVVVGVGLAALGLGSAVPALSEPTTDCSAMARPPAGQADVGSANPLTRPGQLGEITQPPGPEGQMPMDCTPIGHG